MYKGLKHLSKGCELLYKGLKHMFKGLEHKFSRGEKYFSSRGNGNYNRGKKKIFTFEKRNIFLFFSLNQIFRTFAPR